MSFATIRSLVSVTFILLSLRVVANPTPTSIVTVADLPVQAAFTVPIQKIVNTTGGINIAQSGRARWSSSQKVFLQPPPAQPGTSVNATNQVITYTMKLGVGSGTYQDMIVDTGSSNTWVGANYSNPYEPSEQSSSTYGIVQVTYGSGLMFGREIIDIVNLAPGFTIEGQSIGSAIFAFGFNGFDGIAGFGPVDLTKGTVTALLPPSGNSQTVATLMNNIHAQTGIPEILGVYFAPEGLSSENGQLAFGGIDQSKIVSGGIGGVFPTSGQYWGVPSTNFEYGNTSIGGQQTCIADTGTTFLYMSSDAFQGYQNLTGATLDSTTGLLYITSDQYSNLKNLNINIAETVRIIVLELSIANLPHIISQMKQFYLTPNAQIFPRALNKGIGGDPNKIYLVAASSGTGSGSDLNCIIGLVFLERWYSFYNTQNQTIGFWQTSLTNANTN
ncbi:hypothetical protein D9757_005904 [Collybiopsis confluens]|uniref:Peptidase A1 domain-containing protein n=1 Tax=Collybiopsis confluens TaxID=2823264 RepID=A0A8H5HNA4_9AGAR|nr:hypothetical protein D9757_005904 [Collybiopsis confluens]